MKPVRKILVPVDFSACATAALDLALTFAKRFDAAIELLHVWEPPGYVPLDTALASIGTGPPQTLGQIARAEAENEMRALVDKLDVSPEISLARRVESGNIRDTILQLADDGDFDLIIMGTHGRQGLSHVVMGSCAERVVRRASCPVITVAAKS